MAKNKKNRENKSETMGFWKPGEKRPSPGTGPSADNVGERGAGEETPRQSIENNKTEQKEQMQEKRSPSKLSGRTLAMKFMARKREEAEKASKEAELRKKIEASHWTLKAAAEGEKEGHNQLTLVKDAERAPVVFPRGRRSFGGFNPHIENLYEQTYNSDTRKRKEKTATEEEEDLSEGEMTERLKKFVGLRGLSHKKRRSKSPGKGSSKKKSRK